jgi:hypothetical protein
LTAIHSGMMDKKDGNSSPPQLQKPILHGKPGIAGTLAAIRQERRKIIQNQQIDSIEMAFKLLLPFTTAEIDTSFGIVGCQNTKSVTWNLRIKSGEYQVQPRLQV